MDDKNKKTKFVIIHSHMYQPPREDPFTGDFDFDFSAKPYECWNHRIAMECYFPNLYGRVFDKNCEIIEMINNYDYLNFNFGPTLLNWMEVKYPIYYKKIIDTVKKIKEKKGFSPAIAQVYNHTILPLDSFETQINQVVWGIKDFYNRFGFNPDGIWLSETAVNENVLRILIDHNIKYIILAPYQIKYCLDIKTKETKKVLPNEHYIWFDRNKEGKKIESRSINIFTYDLELSQKIAFENLTFNAEIFAKNIAEKTTPSNFILIATDGETYGHHHKFADLTLSYAFRYEFEKYSLKPITISEYLSTHSPKYEAEINEGIDGDGTSWSCSHGVRRWKGGCPCGDEGKYDTSWRFAFRLAAKWLDEVINDIYFEEGKKIFKDPLNTRLNYIDVINGKKGFIEFIKDHILKEDDKSYEKANKILLMIKYQMFSLTSCGWFFNDISRIEVQQDMKYALKAMSIAEELGYKGIEKGYLSLIEMAKSNFSKLKDGKNIYIKFVKPSKLKNETIHSYLVLKTIFLNKENYLNLIYEIKIYEKNIIQNTIIAKAEIRDTESIKDFFVLLEFDFTDREKIKTKIKYYNDKNFKIEENNFEISFDEYSDKIQLELLKYIAQITKERNIEFYEKEFEIFKSQIKINKNMAFENFEDDIKYFSFQLITAYLIKFIKNIDFSNIEKINDIIKTLKEINFEIDYRITNDIINLMPNFTEKLYNIQIEKEKLINLKNIFKELKIFPFLFHIENIIFEKFNTTNK
jgi:hypothetical protein